MQRPQQVGQELRTVRRETVKRNKKQKQVTDKKEKQKLVTYKKDKIVVKER